MQVYIWRKALKNYSYGVIVAYAETVEQARDLALHSQGYSAADVETWHADPELCDPMLDRLMTDLQRDPEAHTNPLAVVQWGGE